MSAFLCEDKIISTIASVLAGQDHILAMLGCDNQEQVGVMLYGANLYSVLYRYPDSTEEEWRGEDSTYEFKHCDVEDLSTNAIQIIKTIQCFMYQACESDTWGKSKIKVACEAMIGLCAYDYYSNTPEYNQAKWGV